jgi:hypothetical protein
MNINTSVSRARTLVRLNHMNRGIEPCDVYLLIVEEMMLLVVAALFFMVVCSH